jgi:hypothetical protein
MSLPAGQQRVLDAIENRLSTREPRLASMFAIFTRLTTNEALPRLEALDAFPWWSPRRWSSQSPRPYRSSPAPACYGPLGRARAVVFLTLAAVLVVAAVFISVNGARGCAGPIVVRGPLTESTHVRSCPTVPQAKGFGHGP